MFNKQKIIIFLITLIISILLGGTVYGSNNAIDAEKVIRLEGGDFGLPNPFRHLVGKEPGIARMQLIYDSLLEKDEKGDIPWLAKTWEISSDGKVYTFTLQENVKWHDGEDMTAEDVKFTFEYYKENPPAYNELIVNNEYIIESIEIIDSHTIKISMNASSATYLTKIGKMRIIPKHIWENVDDPINFDEKEAVIGCGPFLMKEYIPEQGAYQFEAFENYWGSKQKVKAIEWIPVSDPVLAFENGEINLMIATPDILSRYENNNEYQILKSNPYQGFQVVLNMDKQPELKDIDIRKALAYGIDRKEMVEKIGRGSGVVNSMGCIPPGHPWYNDQVEKYSYDPEKAKSYLNGRELTFNIIARSTIPPEIKIAELMKVSLGKIGITLNVQSVDRKTRDAAVKSRNYEMAVFISGFGGDPDYLRKYYGSGKADGESGWLPGYFNQQIYDLAQEQVHEMDLKKRKELIFKLQELVAADIPQILLYNNIDNYVFKPSYYDGWMFSYDNSKTDQCKLSYLERNK